MITWEDTLIDDRYFNKWKPKNSKAIEIKKMTTEHINNSIRTLDKIIFAFPGEQIYTGDSCYAEDAVNSENACNAALLEALQAKKQLLKEELRRRR